MAAAPLLLASIMLMSSEAPRALGDQLNHTELTGGANDMQLVAYDHAGDVLGSIALWTDPDGTTWIVSDYGDGFSQVMITPDGEVSTEATLPSEVIAARAELIIDTIQNQSEPQEGKVSCALSLAGTVVSCAAASWFCPVTAISTACNCMPLVVKEWKGKKCPGFG